MDYIIFFKVCKHQQSVHSMAEEDNYNNTSSDEFFIGAMHTIVQKMNVLESKWHIH